MKLPQIQNAPSGRKDKRQTSFGGLNHTLGAADGEIYDMRNLSSKDFPVLSVRDGRKLYKKLEKANGIFAWDGLVYVDGTKLFFGDKLITEVTDSRKRFAGIGNYVVMLPDKLYINTQTKEYGYLESKWSGDTLSFGNGKLFEEDADANMIQKVGVNWAEYFNVGDAVTISGCTKHPQNNKTPIIRGIDGDKLYFYENAFVLDGEEGLDPYIESGELKIERTVPDMDYICENENRLFGCKGNEIYSSKLGDIFNWNVYDGLTTDSYAVDVGSAGEFSGCCSYGGYAVFFKPEHIYKLYGNYPSAYQLMGSHTLGLEDGSGDGIAIAGETLFFLSRVGFTAYTGGIPKPVSAVFGNEHYKDAVAGSDGLKYYVSCEKDDGSHRLFVYDTQNRCWHIEDETDAVGFAYYNGCLYMLCADGRMLVEGSTVMAPAGCTDEEPVKWMCEFADAYNKSPDAKGITKLQLRIEFDKAAHCDVEIMYDSDGKWIYAGRIDGSEKQEFVVPLIVRRCDHYKIRLSGKGGCRLYSLAKELYYGSDGKTRR